jgi:hypothetical protein
MTVGNGSYQKESGNGSNGYEPIGDASSAGGGGKKKAFMVVVLFAVVAAVGLMVTHKPAGAATATAVKKAGLETTKNGKLKLFDNFRKYQSIMYTCIQIYVCVEKSYFV